MEGHHQHHQHLHQQHHQMQQQQQQHQQHQIQIQQMEATTTTTSSDRFPQWSVAETKEFLMIRAELDRTFMETKRNKLLWEVIANKMKEKGFNRSAEQCKCKWKNLVTRYKGCETVEAESVRQQFPYYSELQAIFTARMQRMLWAEAEGGGGSGSGLKKKGVQLSSDEEDENEESETVSGSIKKRKKMKSVSGSGGSGGTVKEILEDFMKQQMAMEMQWREAFEARESERRLKEMEWRQTMEALENERIMMDRRWREREEQRRMREEARAEKRDALITTLLNKLRKDNQQQQDNI